MTFALFSLTNQPLFDGLCEVFFEVLVSESQGTMESYLHGSYTISRPFLPRIFHAKSLNLVPFGSEDEFEDSVEILRLSSG
jgi:hypothetical protein